MSESPQASGRHESAASRVETKARPILMAECYKRFMPRKMPKRPDEGDEAEDQHKPVNVLAKAILEAVSSVPATREQESPLPRERVRAIQTTAALKAAAV